MMMHIDMVYRYPIWAVGFSLMFAGVVGTILLEFAVRHFVPAELRRLHNDVAGPIFSIIGVTYAVLLAFVATLTWDDFNKARATSYHEAALVLDVFQAADGLAEPARSNMIAILKRYTSTVIAVEWPAHAEGHVTHAADRYLDELHRLTTGLTLSGQSDMNLHALLMQSMSQLRDARQDRLLAAETAVPGIVWFVLILGGTITIAFGSFLGAASVRMHLFMCAMLAVSGVLVLVLIIALSNPFRGDFRVSTAPFDYVLSQIDASP